MNNRGDRNQDSSHILFWYCFRVRYIPRLHDQNGKNVLIFPLASAITEEEEHWSAHERPACTSVAFCTTEPHITGQASVAVWTWLSVFLWGIFIAASHWGERDPSERFNKCSPGPYVTWLTKNPNYWVPISAVVWSFQKIHTCGYFRILRWIK